MRQGADRPKSLGIRKLRRKSLRGPRAVKDYHVHWGIWNAMCIPWGQNILRKDLGGP